MSGRELVILLLGLAIVAVVLRGLYVALNARRGQIKLAIDKNIPQNVDLEALEMAELPGGGARVVTRSLEEVNRQNSALDMAESKARAIDLADDGDESHIPVLMDAVELSQPAEIKEEPVTQQQENPQWEEPEELDAAAEASDEQNSVHAEESPVEPEDVDEEEFTSYIDQSPSIGEGWEEETAADITGNDGTEQVLEASDEEEDPDAVLFDYDEDDSEQDERRNQVDGLSSVAPDYDDTDTEEPVAAAPDNDSYDEDRSDAYLDEDAQDEQDVYAGADDQADEEPERESFDANSDLEEFSMTAGERIGGNPPVFGEIKQSSLFDEDDEVETADTENKSSKSRSLFAMFGRKSEQRQEHPVQEEEVAATLAEDVNELDESDWPEHEEEIPAELKEQPLIPEVEIVNELDQKRAASVEHETEAPQAEEFEHSEVLVLNVAAKDGRVFAGDDLLHILIMSGLKFGDMNIFHKRLSKDNQGAVIFSVANMLNPGTFDLNKMDEFTTLGISFFLALPTPINNLDAFEQMLGVAQDIRDTLGGDLKDDHRNGMTAQTIEHYRQRIRDFELRRLKAVAARG